MRRLRHRDDSGLTLTELIVYSMLLGFVMLIVATVLVRTLQTQRDVSAISGANNDAQLAFSRVERDIRNAAQAKIAHGGAVLLLTTREASDTDVNRWRCVGYFYDKDGQTLRRTSAATGSVTTAAAATGTLAAAKSLASSWTTLLEDTTSIGARAFGAVDGTVLSGGQIAAKLRTATLDGRKPVELTTSTNLRAQSTAGTVCF